MKSVYRPSGGRCRGGVNLIQALLWNVGTCRFNAKGKVQWKLIYENESTNEKHRGGVTRSNFDVYESAWSKGVTSFDSIYKPTSSRRSL